MKSILLKGKLFVLASPELLSFAAFLWLTKDPFLYVGSLSLFFDVSLGTIPSIIVLFSLNSMAKVYERCIF